MINIGVHRIRRKDANACRYKTTFGFYTFGMNYCKGVGLNLIYFGIHAYKDRRI